jgi:hypothetical protein
MYLYVGLLAPFSMGGRSLIVSLTIIEWNVAASGVLFATAQCLPSGRLIFSLELAKTCIDGQLQILQRSKGTPLSLPLHH